jgi:hypothetical protein
MLLSRGYEADEMGLGKVRTKRHLDLQAPFTFALFADHPNYRIYRVSARAG